MHAGRTRARSGHGVRAGGAANQPGPTSVGDWNRRRAILPASRAGSASVDGRAAGMDTRLFESPMPSVGRPWRGDEAAPGWPCSRPHPYPRQPNSNKLTSPQLAPRSELQHSALAHHCTHFEVCAHLVPTGSGLAALASALGRQITCTGGGGLGDKGVPGQALTPESSPVCIPPSCPCTAACRTRLPFLPVFMFR